MPMNFYDYDFGRIGIAEVDGAITHLYFPDESIPEGLEVRETPVLKLAADQLQKYFTRELEVFDLPLAPEGTDFMKKTWASLCDIPYGKTATYKEIAIKIGSPKACRAVGMANNRNPIPIIIPCHRVIGSNGALVGYGGGLPLKEKLLELERQ